jgi:hypothetical protein
MLLVLRNHKSPLTWLLLGNIIGGGGSMRTHSPSMASRLSAAVRLAFTGGESTSGAAAGNASASIQLLNAYGDSDDDDEVVFTRPAAGVSISGVCAVCACSCRWRRAVVCGHFSRNISATVKQLILSISHSTN